MSVPLFCLDGLPHCWHSAELQHAVNVECGVHIDQICCWCGTESCRDVINGRRARDSHGERIPSREIERHTGTKVRNALKFFRTNPPPKSKNPLTPRYKEYLELVVKGMTRREILDFFGWTQSGLKSKLSRIRKALGARTTLQAVAIAVKNRYI